MGHTFCASDPEADSLVDLNRHQPMLTNVLNGEELTMGFESDLGVKTDGLLAGITPQERALVLLDHRKGRSQER